MASEIDWLPVGLEAIALRIARADEAAFRIGELASAWSSHALEVSERDRGDGWLELAVDRVRPVPPLLPLLFSEAINHLRAAVDNTLFFIVETTRGGPLPESQAKRVAFPIYDDAKAFRKWKEENARKGVLELNMDSTLAARIESLQPYRDVSIVRSVSEQLSAITGVKSESIAPLTLLQKYSNDDKHRSIRMAAARTAMQRSDEPFMTSNKNMEPVEAGQVLHQIREDQGVQIDMQTAATVARPSGVTWVAPVPELDKLRRHVTEVVLPTLLTGIALPKGLPPEIDLLDSGLSERERIDNAGWTSALARVQKQMLPAFIEAIT